jgi:hypothetical protein
MLISSNTPYLDLMPLVSYVLSVIGYMPEIYSLLYMICTKKEPASRVINSNSIWVIWVASALIYVGYAIFKGEYVFALSNGITASLCSLIFILRMLVPPMSPQSPASSESVGITIENLPLDAPPTTDALDTPDNV